MEKALRVNVDGTAEVLEFVKGSSYQMLRDAVDGYIECVAIQEGIDLWLNEEGKLIGLQPNLVATKLYRNAYPTNDFIVGDVVITGGADEEGETLGLSETHLMTLQSIVALEQANLVIGYLKEMR